MKLYYATGTCSLSPHIVALEAGIPLDIERVDIFRKPHVTGAGNDFTTVNPNAYVPVLELDDGSLLTEGAAIVQYLADLKPEIGLAPAAGTRERYQLQSWLNFVATELHKMYSPWLFHPEYGANAQAGARDKIRQRLAFVETHLAGDGPYLMSDQFTAADAYLFTIVEWSSLTGIDLTPFPAIRTYLARIAGRPSVVEARAAERRKAAA